jgi:von Willebrand factor type A domain
MSENRIARNEAWIASLVFHVALLAGVIAFVGRPRETADGPIVINTRDTGHEIGVVLLDPPAVRSVTVQTAAPRPPKPPVVPTSPVPPIPQPPAPPSVRTVAHQEPVAGPPAPSVQPNSPAAVSSAPGLPVSPVTNDSGSPLPAGAATAFFGVPAIGKSVVFVLDRSASMGLDGRLDRARRELAVSLRRLPPSARFQVIVYNKVAERVRVSGMVGLLPATPEAIEEAIAAVNRLPAEGGSEHVNALTEALSLVPDVIYFLTDEDDLETRDVQAVTRKNHGRVCIHALCLVPAAGAESPMQMLARGNRGAFKVVGW